MGGRWNTSGIQLICLSIFILVLKIQGHCLLNYEGFALLSFRASVVSDPLGALSDWNPDDCNPCLWSGVHCVNGRVQMLDLAGLSLQGGLAPSLGKLTHLKILILSHNQFSGSVPKEYSGLPMLEIMDLRSNSLNGIIPSEITEMPSLKCLLVQNNNFEGVASKQNRNIDISTKLLSDGKHVSGAAAEYSCVNRKLGHRIFHCHILSLKNKEAFTKAETRLKAELVSTQIQETLNHYLRMLPSPKFEESLFTDDAEVFCNNPRSSSESHNLDNTVRRRLAEQSSNLAAAPATGASAAEPIIVLPSTRSSGSFPAVPKEKKEPLHSPAPAPPKHHHSVAQPQNANNRYSGDEWKYIVGILVAVFFALLVTFICFVCRNLAVKNIRPWKTGLSGQLQKAFVTGVPKLNRDELETACEDFSNIFEAHDSVTVYKGILSSGVEIAVASTSIKSRKEWSKRSEYVYRKQIDSLSRINHKNFANLIGYCEENEPFARMLVFEFVPNGTLFQHLHMKELEHLDWNARVRIIMGIAYCLQYMHGLNPPMPHSNLKSHTIFLTEDYAAKIAETEFWNELQYKSRVSTRKESGHCDLPPPADVETDVYNFGVLLLEIISGRLSFSEEQGHIVTWASKYLTDKQKYKCMIDHTLKAFKNDELEVICDIVQECIHQDPWKRPTLNEIISRLREVIRVSADSAAPRLSPLWWAELEILSAEAA
ncbi:protein MALE DISCOVERER 2 isoform X2 [Daucus carota subsp. sativus]|uniref:Protein kinase domain-containing protein n=1 Tax=Daucus carota subsp. sativus TaxID=79200 RepID=A0A175YLX0_DAUCS|nr:PREDICTED: protein MALE DISCOVERER 2-like [Daucus carota subsp. sativus]XP_017221929.1 PREDICTED: protein MALE DISCOVERER 2-like [Daucus carota subsp. sativus]